MIVVNIESRRRSHPWASTVVLLSSILLLQGCAAALGVIATVHAIGGVAIMANPDLEGLPKTETNRATFAYPVDTVYWTLRHTVEQNGRRVVEPIAATYTLHVSYPFSLLANNWGGVITIICYPEGQDTTIVIVGSGRDTNARLQKIGVEIIHDLEVALSLESEAR